MEQRKTRKKLGLAFIALATLLMVLLNSVLLYTCINLYKMDYRKDFACMIIGVVFIGLILGFLYIILITWKEFKEKDKIRR